MSSLIIGHRGFVGSNLKRQLVNSIGVGRQDIQNCSGESFDEIFCAAPQAKKWWANQNPEEDRQEVEVLMDACKKIGCNKNFFLFSTVDVYDPPDKVNENSMPNALGHPYGANRVFLENEILNHFGDKKTKIIRLPALVGDGLKKNIIFDLLNNNNIHNININASFQWFNLKFLGQVIRTFKSVENECFLNVAPEPIKTAQIIDTWFKNLESDIDFDRRAIKYDVHTKFGRIEGKYMFSANEVMDNHLKPFIESNI